MLQKDRHGKWFHKIIIRSQIKCLDHIALLISGCQNQNRDLAVLPSLPAGFCSLTVGQIDIYDHQIRQLRDQVKSLSESMCPQDLIARSCKHAGESFIEQYVIFYDRNRFHILSSLNCFFLFDNYGLAS